MKVTIKEKNRVYDGFFKIDEAVIEHEKFDGSTQTIKRLCFERGDAVAAVVYDPVAKKLLFTEQFRYPAFTRSGEPTIIELVAGMTKAGEHHQDTLIREIKEELGYTAKTIKYLGCYFLSPGGSSERIHLYFVELNEKIGGGGGLLEESEDIQVVRMSVNDILKDISFGLFNDAKTQLGLELSKNYWSN